jgi:hypothetical protein
VREEEEEERREGEKKREKERERTGKRRVTEYDFLYFSFSLFPPLVFRSYVCLYSLNQSTARLLSVLLFLSKER